VVASAPTALRAEDVPPKKVPGAGAGGARGEGAPRPAEGKGGGGPPGGDEPPGGGGDDGGLLARLPPVARRLLLLMVEYGGVNGTAAVAIGWFLGIAPLATAHWDPADLATAAVLFAPLALFDAVVMAPDYGAMGPDGAAATAAAAEANKGPSVRLFRARDGEDAEAAAPPPADSAAEVLRAGLEAAQTVYAAGNPAARVPLAGELAVVGVASLADEMLFRGVLFTALSRWIADRLFEGGAEGTPALLAALGLGAELPVAEWGQWGAVGAGLFLGSLALGGRLLRQASALQRVRVLTGAGGAADVAAVAGVPAGEARRRLEAGVRNGSWVTGVQGARDLLEFAAASGTFALTGNVAASWAGAAACSAAFSAYQRVGARRLDARRAKAMARSAASRRGRRDEVQDAMAALRGSGGGAAAADKADADGVPAPPAAGADAPPSTSAPAPPGATTPGGGVRTRVAIDPERIGVAITRPVSARELEKQMEELRGKLAKRGRDAGRARADGVAAAAEAAAAAVAGKAAPTLEQTFLELMSLRSGGGGGAASSAPGAAPGGGDVSTPVAGEGGGEAPTAAPAAAAAAKEE